MPSGNDGSRPARPTPGISPMTSSAPGDRGSGSGGRPPAPPVAQRPGPPYRPRNRKMRWLRIGGLVVMLAGAAAVAYVGNAVWITGAQTGGAEEQLAPDFAAPP